MIVHPRNDLPRACEFVAHFERLPSEFGRQWQRCGDFADVTFVYRNQISFRP
jgi:hypothetical protein